MFKDVLIRLQRLDGEADETAVQVFSRYMDSEEEVFLKQIVRSFAKISATYI